jgi:hypothetical protein
MVSSGWIGVDLDGTLAKYVGWNEGVIGDPIPAMAERVREWLRAGKDVRIVTARVAAAFLPRASDAARAEAADQCVRIMEWTERHFGRALPVTAVKDYGMIELWDDRAITVEMNTGRIVRAEVS